jgi:cell division cycle 20-like protein 1, cofactor of APC complex
MLDISSLALEQSNNHGNITDLDTAVKSTSQQATVESQIDSPEMLQRTTPKHHDLTTSIVSVVSTPTVDTSFSNTSTSSSVTRIPLPSPNRPRLDLQYSVRLNSMKCMENEKGNIDGNSFAPPSIQRIINTQSIFRPNSNLISSRICSPSSESGSFALESPERKARHHFTYGSIPSGNTGNYVHSSFSSAGTSGTFTSRYRSDIGQADRYIPSRVTSNFNYSIWDESSSRPANDHSSSEGALSESLGEDRSSYSNVNGGEISTTSTPPSSAIAQSSILNTLLRSELLGENVDPFLSRGSSTSGQSGTSIGALHEGSLFHYRSPRQEFQRSSQDHMFDLNTVVDSFSLSPIGSGTTQRVICAPQKRLRRIQKVPFKVLDAPALQDDFYLNLVDWSSQNVLAVGLGSCVYLWSACTCKVTKLCDLAVSEDMVTSVAWAQRGTHLAVGTNKGEVQLWDTIKCRNVRTMSGHSARVGTLNFSGVSLASGSRDRLVYVRDVRIQSPYTHRLSAHKQEVCGLKWSSDEPAFLASGGNDNKLLIWDIKNSCHPVNRFSEHSAAVKAIAWSPHQHGLLASGGGTADRCIRFWNALSGVGLHHIDTGSQICNLAWSKNCNEIVSTHGYSLNQIVVWRYPSMSKVITLTGHTFRVLYLAMSPDGSTIVTGAGDETLRFWQIFPGPRSLDKSNSHGLLFPALPGSVIR